VTCREFADFIIDYVSGDLTADVSAPFERHLSRCPSCRAYLAQYRTTVAAGKDAFSTPDGELPDDVPEDLVQAILASRRGS
jgi:anti-sigma factor RsiW